MATMTAEDRPRYDELISKGMPSSVTIKKIEAEKDIKVKSEKTALRGKEIKEGETKAKAEEAAKIKKETERSEREAEKEKREKEKEKSSREKDRERDRDRRDRDRDKGKDRDRDKGKDRDRDKGRDTDRYSKDYSKDYDKGGKDKMARKGGGMVSHIVSDLQEEGGNFVGEGVGLIGGLYLSEYVGNLIEKSVTPQSSTFGNVISWTLNNFPKVIAYYLVNRYVGYYEDRGIIGGAMYGAKISLPTSIMLDTYYRLAHKKLLDMSESNESVIKEKLNQENNILRIRLQSLQSLQYVLDSLKDRLKLSERESQQPTVIFRQALSDNSEHKQMSNNPVIEQQQPIQQQPIIEQAKHNAMLELYHKNSFKSVNNIGSLFGML